LFTYYLSEEDLTNAQNLESKAKRGVFYQAYANTKQNKLKQVQHFNFGQPKQSKIIDFV
jgi:hypothetical protein